MCIYLLLFFFDTQTWHQDGLRGVEKSLGYPLPFSLLAAWPQNEVMETSNSVMIIHLQNRAQENWPVPSKGFEEEKKLEKPFTVPNSVHIPDQMRTLVSIKGVSA